MKKISLPLAANYTSPNPLTLVCTRKEDGKINVATVSWWTYLSYNPNMVAFAMSKMSYSGEIIRQNKEVVITIPGEELRTIALECGLTSGRNVNKVEKFNIELIDLLNTNIKVPKHSSLVVVCNLKEFIEVGDHFLYICNVKDVYVDENEKPLFAWNGYRDIHTI